MSGNSFGTLFKITSFGESHGEGVGVILDVINAQVTVQQAANALITARYDLNTRKSQLYQTLGLDIIEFLR